MFDVVVVHPTSTSNSHHTFSHDVAVIHTLREERGYGKVVKGIIVNLKNYFSSYVITNAYLCGDNNN